jgi:hypothetical protein
MNPTRDGRKLWSSSGGYNVNIVIVAIGGGPPPEHAIFLDMPRFLETADT